MKLSEAEIKKWVRLISDDIMHFSNEEESYVCSIAKIFDFEILPDDSGVVGYFIAKDFDCKRKMNVLLLYCRPESRGRSFMKMIHILERIALEEGVEEIMVGGSITGYKVDKLNMALERLGYRPSGYSKRI